MQKHAPSLPRILAMVLFAFSCFGLLLFLWMSFGGPAPLNPKGYRVQVAFEEAAQLGLEADVRVAGVTIGTVKEKAVDPSDNRLLATIEIDRKYAPIAQNARAMLRQKAILGETYVELTLGDRNGPAVPEGGRLENRNVQQSVQLDEILNTLDPITRKAFRTWQQDLSKGLRGRGQDLNDAIGNLPGFVDAGGDLLEVLDSQRAALRGLVRNTGVVFGALTEKEDQLRALIENSDTLFTAIQREKESFADIWKVAPTFLRESRATYSRLERFSRDTRPLVRELKPALDDLGPTLEDVARLAPHLRKLYRDLDPLLRRSLRSLPATRQVLEGLRPLLGELAPFLSELNPVLDWVAQHQNTLTDVFANLGGATAARTASGYPGAPGHYLRQLGVTGTETVAIHPNRLSTNRGNAYLNPYGVLPTPDGASKFILPSFDCANTGVGEKDNRSGTPPSPSCRVQKPFPYEGNTQRFPNITRDDYSRP